MSTLIVTVLQLLANFLPQIITGATGAQITSIIGVVEQAVPIAVQVGEDLAQPIRNIIAALRTSGAVTADQLAALDTQEAALDAAFDAAADAATKADTAPSS